MGLIRRGSRRTQKWTSAAARRFLKLAGDPPSVDAAVRIVGKQFLEGVSCPPTDLEALCFKLGITEICSENLPYSGELRKNNDGFKIVYSSYMSQERKRFTIAHEIGHAIFEMTGKNCPRHGRELEQICNMLASELLMPKDIFLKYAEREISLDRIYKLAGIFNSSLSATALRYAQVGNFFVFEVKIDEVILSNGLIRKGPIKRLDGHLQQLIERTFSGQEIVEKVYFRNRYWDDYWRLEGRLIGNSSRALFLLEPIIKSIHN